MEVIVQFLDYIRFEKRFSQHTVLAYKTDLEQFVNFLDPTRNLLEVNANEIRSWLAEMSEMGLDFRTIKRKLASIKSFYKYCKLRSFLTINPASLLKGPKIAKLLPEVVPQLDIKKLYSKSFDSNSTFSESRNLLIIFMLYETGMRRAELVDLQLNNFDFSRKSLLVFGKGQKVRNIPISDELITRIKRYLLIRSESFLEMSYHFFLTDHGKAIYPRMVHRIVDQKLKEITLTQKRSPHVLRHSFATHLVDGGADIYAIKELLGHSSLTATQIYTHTSMAQIVEMYKKFHPRSGSE